MSSDYIRITEIGPRDGLQGEPSFMPTSLKQTLVKTLAAAGLSEVEVTAFVHPAWIPNMADAEEVVKDTAGLAAARYALVPNERGLRRALESGIEGITTVFSATEAHNRSNLNRATDESLAEVIAVGKQAAAAGLNLRASISTVFGCPFGEAPTDERILELIHKLAQGGYSRVGLCDTIGVGNPAQVKRIVRRVLNEFPEIEFDLHFHDTYGRGLANVLAALDAGARSFDSSIGGLGGCPYAPGATGNVSTEDLAALLESMGLKTGIRMDDLFQASALVAEWRAEPLESQCWRVWKSQNMEEGDA